MNLKALIAIIFATLLTFGCTKSDFTQKISEYNLDKSSETSIKDYDKRMDKLAKSLSSALGHPEIRSILKYKALEEWDGDTEFLLKDILDINISTEESIISIFSKHLHFNDEASLKKELYCYGSCDTLNVGIAELKKKYLRLFSEDFPSLAIAIRGPVGNWDTKSYHPSVIYIPSNFNENWEEINAYSVKGKKQKLNIRKAFEHPVVVLMKCERTDLSGKLKKGYKRNLNINKSRDLTLPFFEIPAPDSCQPIAAPQNLLAELQPNGIYLSWDYSGSHPDEWVRIKIYRDGGGETGKFIAEKNALEAFTLFDNSNLIPNNQYRYYAYAYAISKTGNCEQTEYNFSNWVTPISEAYEITNLKVINDGPVNNIYWTRPSNKNYAGIKIYCKPPQSSSWNLVADLNGINDESFIHTHNSSDWGQDIQYQAFTYDNYGTSNALYDVAKLSERTNMQGFYINAIKVEDLYPIESAVFGKPEFEVTISHYDPNDLVENDDDPINTHYVTKEEILSAPLLDYYEPQDLIFNDGHYEGVYNQCITLWDNTFYKSVFNIQVAEHDDQVIGTIYKASLALMKAVKTGLTDSNKIEQTGVDAAIGVTQVLMDEWNMDRGDKQIGAKDYPFWFPRDYTLMLSYGCKVRLGWMPYLGYQSEGNTWEPEWDLNQNP